MDGDPRHEDCWAKTTEDGLPGISVRDHCLNVGCVAEALVNTPARGAVTLAALHDVGKVSPGFQRKCERWILRHNLLERACKEAWSVLESDHAKISQSTVQGLLGKSSLRPWAAAVGAHHGRIKGERVSVREPWEPERQRLAGELIREFGPLPDQPPGTSHALLWFVAGLITVADWIGSDEEQFPQDARWEMPERRAKARSALARIGWKRAAVKPAVSFEELFPEIPGPNSLQTAAARAVRAPGTYVIEGPMGFGKTEAALVAAYQLIASGHADGLYFALPTQLTSNRIHLRVESFVERITDAKSSVRLAHGASWLVQDEPPPQLQPASLNDSDAREHVRAGRSWFASPKRALLAPYGVGTIDQALLGVVAAKHFFVRQFALARKVVILDEVHTYDLYTSTLIDGLVRQLRELGSTVLVLSATLTEARRRQLLGTESNDPLGGAYPLVSGSAAAPLEIASEPPPSKSVAIRFVEPRSLVDDALASAQRGQCVLWIRNTVDEAQETFRCLRAANHQGGPDIALLHSRFPFFRREQLESDWMERLGKNARNRPNGCVLVCTQVAEQSVDIDADLLITDLAPTDMMLQRIGRLWRHERSRPADWRPEVWIPGLDVSEKELASATASDLKVALGKSAKVYAPYVLLRSLAQWRGRETITLPGEVRALLEATYAKAPPDEPGAWRQLRDELEEKKQELAAIAQFATKVWTQPALPDEEDVQTRHSNYPSAGLLLVRGIETLGSQRARLSLLDGSESEADERHWSFGAAKAIHRNVVRVPCWAIAEGLRNPPGWLTNHTAQPTALGLLEPDGVVAWTACETRTQLSYLADQGVIIRRVAVPRRSLEDPDESYD
jgi:CRISPR-associated endonuclease/helicase Cas3